MARRTILLMLVVACECLIVAPAHPQGWPQRPVRIIVPFAPGGNTDAIARIVAQRLGESFPRQFIVDNRPGAGGALAAEAVVRAPADGHTLFLTSVSVLAVLPAMTRTSFEPLRDFVTISNIGTNPNVLTTNASFPPKTVAEFVAYVRRQPQTLTYAASVTGSLAHLSMALFLKRAGLEMIPVTYKGGTAPLTDVIAGHVPTYFAPLSDVLAYRNTSALRLLAVSSEKRARQLPEVPSLSEEGFPGFNTLTWNGLLAPIGTPKEVVDRIAQEIARAVTEPAFIERLTTLGVEPLGNGPQEFAAQLAADIRFWAEAVKIAGLEENQ
jgi:tripartite-type tricarboxylate transporter receptor subunit TctC